MMAKDWTAREIPVDEDTPIPLDDPEAAEETLLAFLDTPVHPIGR